MEGTKDEVCERDKDKMMKTRFSSTVHFFFPFLKKNLLSTAALSPRPPPQKKQSKAKREKERSDAVVLRGKKKDDDGERERERRELPRAGGQKPSKKRN